MRKLTKEQLRTRDDLVERLRSTGSGIEQLYAEAEQVINNLNDAVEAYNEVAQEAVDFCSEVAEAADSYYSDRSEKWQESDKGYAYSDWRDKFQAIADSNHELEKLPDAEDMYQNLTLADELEELTEEPDE